MGLITSTQSDHSTWPVIGTNTVRLARAAIEPRGKLRLAFIAGKLPRGLRVGVRLEPDGRRDVAATAAGRTAAGSATP